MPAFIYLFMLLLPVSLVDLNLSNLIFKSSNPSIFAGALKSNKWEEQRYQTPLEPISEKQIDNPRKRSLDCPSTHPKVHWNLAGIPGDGYYISAQIGTPPQTVNLLVDTGSSNLAVAGANEATLDTFFKPNNSSSFVILNNTSIKVSYTQGWWEGELGSDVVVLPSLACHLQTRSFVALIRRSHCFYVAGSHWQGILGLAFPELAQPNKSVQPWFDSLLSAHNSSYQLLQQQQSQEIVFDEATTLNVPEMPHLDSDGNSTIETPSMLLTSNTPRKLQLPRNDSENGPSAIKGKSVVQTNESPSLPHKVVNKGKFVSNSSSLMIGGSSQSEVLKKNVFSFRNDTLSSDEYNINESKKKEVERTKFLHFSKGSNSGDYTTIRNMNTIRENEELIINSGIGVEYSLSNKNFSTSPNRQILKLRNKLFSTSLLENDEVTSVQNIVSQFTLPNIFNKTQGNPSQRESTNLTTNLPNLTTTLSEGDGSDNVAVVSSSDRTVALNNIPDDIRSSDVDDGIRTDVPGLTGGTPSGHKISLDDDSLARQDSQSSPATGRTSDDSASVYQTEGLPEETLGTASSGGVLSNTFGMELCGPWSNPQHNTHHGRIMLGSLVDSCGFGPWFEAPILQPWFYEVAVTSMAVGGRPLDLPCTLYNTHASIVDSGTTKLKLPDAVLEAVVLALETAVHQLLPEPLPKNFWRGDGQVCWTDAHTAWSVLPSLSIQIALSNHSSFSIELGPRSYLRPAPVGPAGTTSDGSVISSDDAVDVMAPSLKNSELDSKDLPLALPVKSKNTDRYRDKTSTDIRNVDDHTGLSETQGKVESRSIKNTSFSRSEQTAPFIISSNNEKENVNDSFDATSKMVPQFREAENPEFSFSSRRTSRRERTLSTESQPSAVPPSASPAAVPCWTVGIEPSNMGTVLGVVVLEGLCTRFDRGRGVLGFRRGRCGPAVSLTGPIPHDGAGSCVPGSGGAGTVVLGSLLAVLCFPLLVFFIRWLVVFLRRHAPRLRSSAEAPFLTLDEAPNMFGEH